MNNETKPILFLDFDGTISKCDAIDLILERFADEKWRVIEEKWKDGLIGSRQCLREQVALINASECEINDLLDEIKLDEGFTELLETCRQNRMEIFIVSDGFDYCIKRILSGWRSARKLPIFSSHLEFADGKWKTKFPYFTRFCKHGCATCKPRVMKNLNPHNAPTVFVGDGLSDRYAARAADLVFAKKGLAKYCAAENIEFALYRNLGDVAVKLAELLNEKDFLTRSAMPFNNPFGTQEVFN
ncbi:MAG: MtnX-like HAD-IB family phosphatase [Acidobacteriota bacterium]